jgi:hypothetical protein
VYDFWSVENVTIAILLSFSGLKPNGLCDPTAGTFEGVESATGVEFTSNLKKNSKNSTTATTKILRGSRNRLEKTWREGE